MNENHIKFFIINLTLNSLVKAFKCYTLIKKISVTKNHFSHDTLPENYLIHNYVL